ncbi:DUF7289 family protein [Halovenus sp. HT40]|uniref:DUF7289 family protein n=1 Tax=Halovenus sp. HT40 TaxID=3126691 RepID=UPI003FA59632
MRARNAERRENGNSGRRRAQSETIGFVLLFSLVLIGAGTIIAFGAVAVSDSQNSLSADRAEKVMTQMDSEISMVALGRTDSQEMEFDRASGSDFTVDDEAGTINITTIGGDDNIVVMPDTDLGAVIFERANTKIAYQGGGVWRADGSEGSGMVSPPEFNYRDQTLTLPLVTISGERSLDGGAVVEKDGPSTSYFPNASKDENLTNPLENEIVQVTVESRYHQGWKAYFETRTEGDVTHEPDEQRVSVNLTAPAVEEFEHAAATTSATSPETQNKNKGEIIGTTRKNVNAPSVSPNVDQKISACDPSGCTDRSGFSDGETLTSGTYYVDTGNKITIDEDIDLDVSDGDVNLVFKDGVEFKGNADLDVVGSDNDGGQVRMYSKGDVYFGGTPNVNTGGNPEDVILLAHSTVDEVGNGGSVQFTGYIYAPNSEFNIKGGGSEDENVLGGVVAETVDVGTGVLEHKNENNLEIELGAPVNVLTFLHISTNPVTVTSR